MACSLAVLSIYLKREIYAYVVGEKGEAERLEKVERERDAKEEEEEESESAGAKFLSRETKKTK